MVESCCVRRVCERPVGIETQREAQAETRREANREGKRELEGNG